MTRAHLPASLRRPHFRAELAKAWAHIATAETAGRFFHCFPIRTHRAALRELAAAKACLRRARQSLR